MPYFSRSTRMEQFGKAFLSLSMPLRVTAVSSVVSPSQTRGGHNLGRLKRDGRMIILLLVVAIGPNRQCRDG